jgi:hypothetical protein
MKKSKNRKKWKGRTGKSNDNEVRRESALYEETGVYGEERGEVGRGRGEYEDLLHASTAETTTEAHGALSPSYPRPMASSSSRPRSSQSSSSRSRVRIDAKEVESVESSSNAPPSARLTTSKSCESVPVVTSIHQPEDQGESTAGRGRKTHVAILDDLKRPFPSLPPQR